MLRLKYRAWVVRIRIQPKFYDEIWRAHAKDEWIMKQKEMVMGAEKSKFGIDSQNTLLFRKKIGMPRIIKKRLLEEKHKTRFTVHLGGATIY